MEKEAAFAKALHEIEKTAKEQGNVVSKEQVEDKFAEMKLSEEQFVLVAGYLKSHKIGVEEELNLDDYLTEEEKDYLLIYLEEIAQLSEVSVGEKEAVILSAMAGDKTAKERTIELFLPKVIEVAKLYTGQGVFLEDLIGEGNIALMMGASMLGCLEKPSEAEGMLGKLMMDAMEEFIYENGKNSESDQKLLDRLNQVAKKVQELSETLQRKITVGEIAAEMKLTEEEIKEVLRISGNRMEMIEDSDDAD